MEHQEVIGVHAAHPAVLVHVHAAGHHSQCGGGGVELIAVGINLDSKLWVGRGGIHQLQRGDAPVVPFRLSAGIMPHAVHIGLLAGMGLPPGKLL